MLAGSVFVNIFDRAKLKASSYRSGVVGVTFPMLMIVSGEYWELRVKKPTSSENCTMLTAFN